MVIDTSAIVAILLEEPGHLELKAALEGSNESWISAATSVELAVVAQRILGVADAARIQRLLDSYEVAIAPVDADQARIAAMGHQNYGRGSGHRARLNYGDCFSYALAIALDQPLLFVGDDFNHTDLTPALPR